MKKYLTKLSGIILGICGFAILTVTLYPILKYEWESGFKFPLLISPIPVSEMYSYAGDGSVSGYPKKSSIDPKDFGNAFTISVPRLKIKNALVKIGGEDLSESLIQYPGTAYPGEYGNTVIFGHSVLPMFFNPEKYLTIFSTLTKLKKDDDLTINFGGEILEYKVEAMFEVVPTDIRILDQNFSSSYISLITCTPPGDPRKPKRLIVRAKLVSLNQNS